MPLEDFFAQYGGAEFKFPNIAGQYQGRKLVICADGACIWDDLEAFGCRNNVARGSVAKDGWDFMTVNKLVEVFPGRIEHAYSNQPDHLKAFIAARRNEYAKEFGPPKHVHSISGNYAIRWPFGGRGTSGLAACLVGIGLGYDEIMLCGMPLDNGHHNGEPHWRECRFECSEARSPRDARGQEMNGPNPNWKVAIDHAFQGKVHSMSGRTREWLGC